MFLIMEYIPILMFNELNQKIRNTVLCEDYLTMFIQEWFSSRLKYCTGIAVCNLIQWIVMYGIAYQTCSPPFIFNGMLEVSFAVCLLTASRISHTVQFPGELVVEIRGGITLDIATLPAVYSFRIINASQPGAVLWNRLGANGSFNGLDHVLMTVKIMSSRM